MLRNLWRVAWAALAVNGAFMLWLGRYGSLWEPENAQYLGWLQLYVLRSGLFIVGAATLVAGLWFAWLAYTLPGRVVRGWADDVWHDRQLDREMAGDPEWVNRRWQDDLAGLWYRRRCMVGRHAPTALYYCRGGEEGPRGCHCEDCGLSVPLRTLPPELAEDLKQHGHARLHGHLSLTDALTPEEHDNVVYAPFGRDLDGGPDPLRSVAPDDGCFTQGSDPVLRRSHVCDKEA